jgi:hypothetical protein
VILEVPDVVNVTVCPPLIVKVEPDAPIFVMELLLLSNPLRAINLRVVAMILYPLGG